MKHSQPIDLTKPGWNWELHYKRLKIAWCNRKDWQLYGSWRHTWWLCFRNYPKVYFKDDKINKGEFWQLTILGLNIAYCYRKDFKP